MFNLIENGIGVPERESLVGFEPGAEASASRCSTPIALNIAVESYARVMVGGEKTLMPL